MQIKDFIKNWTRDHVELLLGAALVGMLWLLSSSGIL